MALIRHIIVKVFAPHNKRSRTIRFQAPPKKQFTSRGIQEILERLAGQVEMAYPNEEYELKELNGRQFNFVWKGAKATV